MTKQVLFVVGPLRAGTTFLRLILGMHPRIAMVGEFEEGVEPLGDTGYPSAGAYRHYLSTQRAFQAKRLSVDQAATDYREIAWNLWAQLEARTDKPIVGASIHSRFDRCPDLWPAAKYVHIIRDPRDVARSCIGMGWVGNAYYGADYWTEAELRWDRLERITEPSQRHEVRYEDLVQSPEACLSDICAFLGVEYDAVMLDYPNHSTYAAPEPALAGQWRTKLSLRQVELIENRIGPDLMRRRGYPPATEAGAPTPLERASLLANHRLRRARFGIERLGLKLWLEGKLVRFAPQSSFARRVRTEINAVAARHLR